MVATLVLLRHGQSTWNLEDLFTGWTDVDLTERGVAEVRAGAREVAAAGLEPDVVHTSVLTRAIRTAWLAMEETDRMWVPVRRHWRLNERHYGALQGASKPQVREEHGEEQFRAWRRSYDVPPPPLEPTDPRHPRFDPRYRDVPVDALPATECLRDVLARLLPYWEDVLVPDLAGGRTVLVAAHGNSLRALVKHLSRIADEEIPALDIPTGIPLVYELDDDFRPADDRPVAERYLGDPEAAARAAAEVATQGR